MLNCYNCPERATSHCDHCDKPFCREHGDPGGDRDREGGPVAYPSTCEACRAAKERELGGGR